MIGLFKQFNLPKCELEKDFSIKELMQKKPDLYDKVQSIIKSRVDLNNN